MFIPKANRIAVFTYLFKEGVIVVKKDTISATHPQIEGPTNLEVLMLVKSLESRSFVRVTFNWQYNYVYLTDEGLDYLREYLALPADTVPATHKKKETSRPGGRGEDGGKFGSGGGEGRAAFRGDRDREYRSGGGGGGGFGRGGGM
jgi:small subunit ribosomal protein S10e